MFSVEKKEIEGHAILKMEKRTSGGAMSFGNWKS